MTSKAKKRMCHTLASGLYVIVALSNSHPSAAQAPSPECRNMMGYAILNTANAPRGAPQVSMDRIYTEMRSAQLGGPAMAAGLPSPTMALLAGEKLALTAQQRSKLEAIELRLQSDITLIEPATCKAEDQIKALIQDKTLDEAKLTEALLQSESARSALRAVIIKAHFEVGQILSETQRLQVKRP